ncbi:hypothetical protein Tco_0994577 [Tanacetum coccineum]
MSGNKAYLLDYKHFNEVFVAFGSDPKRGKITSKGKIKTANLDFDDVYFVDELKFNLFSVSQICDKKNSILFTETECLILSPSFKLLDESQVVLRAPRKDKGLYSGIHSASHYILIDIGLVEKMLLQLHMKNLLKVLLKIMMYKIQKMLLTGRTTSDDRR